MDASHRGQYLFFYKKRSLMPKVKFTAALKRFFPNLEEQVVNGETVAEALNALESNYPGLKDYIVDEQGRLRRHVNIFVEGELIQDRLALADPVAEGQEMLIFQALSGG